MRILIEKHAITDDVNGNNISQLFGIAPEEVRLEQGDRYMEWRWQSDNSSYRLYSEDGQWRIATVTFDAAQPSAHDLIDCVGDPEWYVAGYGPWGENQALNFEMYFPTQGLMARSSDLNERKKPRITENTLVDELALTPPGSIAAMISFLHYDAADVGEIALQRLKPWPGNWEDLEFVKPASQ
ncbi:MAG: hypothetical protein K1X65_24535 [Caldilineales bacterium]|nr:hypothetical protein [Caldilineales bacterium]